MSHGAESGPQLDVAFADFPTLGVWTKPGAEFICIEHWHGVSDPVGFGGDARNKPGRFKVAPRSSKTLAMSISLTPTRAGQISREDAHVREPNCDRDRR